LSMIAGAQTVHQLYRPLEDLEEWVKRFEELIIKLTVKLLLLKPHQFSEQTTLNLLSNQRIK